MNSTMKLTREDVYELVLQDWQDKLNDGLSWPKKQLIEATSADLCEAYLATSSSSAYSDLPNPHELAWACFEKEVLPKLRADDRYKVEHDNGQITIRCYEPTVGEGAASPSPTARAHKWVVCGTCARLALPISLSHDHRLVARRFRHAEVGRPRSHGCLL